ncbi:hypothetical protein F993_00490 [Acinetobacter proteolyticus]|uniref:MotA/TolQ/ExbB proton channel domain-containing protein n=1 Tax=Acinetobacter proteolyticus TaxID=1776741 RepID=A0ABN0JIQ0_9GAMM|nr:hypothetical protein [Acinetobacter proteolyticus]ENU25100.1 hypothetical protein F993_00490 [Acinetobacter proteolyticus]
MSKNRKVLLLFAAVGFFITLILFYVVLARYFDLSDISYLKPLIYVVLFVMVLASLVGLMNSFLESNKYVEKREVDLKYLELLRKYNVSVGGQNNEKTIDEAKNLLRDKLEGISAESYFQEFKQKVKAESIVEVLDDKTKSIELRVQGEIARLSKSGIINLSLGMMLSIGGILYLGNFVVNVQTFDSIEKMFINTFPKTVFVLLIEIFAYFFLKLYKQNLDDIKYYQNELTNIESKNLAVQISKQSNNHKLLTLCVEEFLSTERNFILEKDQTTIELEKERISSNNTNNTLQVVKDIFKNK